MNLLGAVLRLVSCSVAAAFVVPEAPSECVSVPSAAVPASACVRSLVTGLRAPRGVELVTVGGVDRALLVVERDRNRVLALVLDSASPSVKPALLSLQPRVVPIASFPGLNHGVAFDADRGLLYASTPSKILRWRWSFTDPPTPATEPTEVLSGIPSAGHSTRTLRVVRDSGQVLFSVGSQNNVDASPSRAGLFSLPPAPLPADLPLQWGDPRVATVVSGLRNKVGLAWHPTTRALWGVENGADKLVHQTGIDIHADNPCEEVNALAWGAEARVPFYGYPYCYSEGSLPATLERGRGEQHVWPSFLGVGERFEGVEVTEEFCRNASLVVKPEFCLQAHTAPLGLAFEEDGRGVFVFLHGSWNREPPVGRTVVRVAPLDEGGYPMEGTAVETVFGLDGREGVWDIRPVDGALVNGTLVFTDDETGTVFGLRLNDAEDAAETETGGPESEDEPACFPADALVMMRDGSEKRMDQLMHGDVVRSGDVVFFFSHRDPSVTSSFVELSYMSGGDTVRRFTPSPGHLVVVRRTDGASVLKEARTIAAGEFLLDADGSPRAVLSARRVTKRGLFNPHATGSCTFVVDGVQSSCFTSAVRPAAARMGLWPLALVFAASRGKAALAFFETHRSWGHEVWRLLSAFPQRL